MNYNDWRLEMEAMAHTDDYAVYRKEHSRLVGIGRANGWLGVAPESFFWSSRIYDLKTKIFNGETVVSLKDGRPLLSLDEVEKRICQGSEDLTEAVRLSALGNHRLAANHLKLCLVYAVHHLLDEYRDELDHERQDYTYQEFRGVA